uniref:hypothetical protein n=1 Tax=Bacillus paralicheniformis TaxID=1648923 RepID=UPI0020C13D72
VPGIILIVGTGLFLPFILRGHNWFVANCSNAGNYYHLLRRQAALLGTEGVRPLVVVSQKSVLRHPVAAANAEQLAHGS